MAEVRVLHDRSFEPSTVVWPDGGTWVADVRRRADELGTERRNNLDQFGMRW
ncbi:hypothetical protein ACF09J_25305 [Streptomyces sp. NPDC014889]|uniref:hypothetical protein n=1 Tax=Streptomyces sp. NPDC014889 TaxID=3364928 RepID=UPI0036F61167